MVTDLVVKQDGGVVVRDAQVAVEEGWQAGHERWYITTVVQHVHIHLTCLDHNTT